MVGSMMVALREQKQGGMRKEIQKRMGVKIKLRKHEGEHVLNIELVTSEHSRV